MLHNPGAERYPLFRMWVRTSFPTRAERLKHALLSGQHPLQFAVVFLLVVAAIAVLHIAGVAIPQMPADAPLLEAFIDAWWVPLGAGFGAALVLQVTALLIWYLSRRRSLELRICPNCGRVYPRLRSRCEKCGKRLSDAEYFTWRVPETPVPPKSDFTGESPFD